MRVLYLIDSLGAGGAEQSLRELAPRLEKRGVELLVCLLKQDVADTFPATGGSSLPVQFLGRPRSVQTVVHLRRLLRSERIELLHTTLFEADLIGRAAAWGSGIPVLTSLVNTTYERIRYSDPAIRPLRLQMARMVDAWTARHLTAHFHAITEEVKSSAVRWLGISPESVTVIPRGRDQIRLGEPGNKRREEVRSRLGLPQDSVVIINVARQEFQKGQRYLIDAMPGILGEVPDATLLMAGRPGSVSSKLERQIQQLGVGNRVRILGHRDDIGDLLAASDIFVFPSLYEGMGGALLEAMALEVPIVASDLPVIREVLDDTAVFVPSRDPTALSTALLDLTSDPTKAQRLARAARVRFEDLFDIDRIADQMVELYAAVRAAHTG